MKKIVFVQFSKKMLTDPITVNGTATNQYIWTKLFENLPEKTKRTSKQISLHKTKE